MSKQLSASQLAARLVDDRLDLSLEDWIDERADEFIEVLQRVRREDRCFSDAQTFNDALKEADQAGLTLEASRAVEDAHQAECIANRTAAFLIGIEVGRRLGGVDVVSVGPRFCFHKAIQSRRRVGKKNHLKEA
jgi:hypothetical protein